jgi:hypothetical protein
LRTRTNVLDEDGSGIGPVALPELTPVHAVVDDQEQGLLHCHEDRCGRGIGGRRFEMVQQHGSRGRPITPPEIDRLAKRFHVFTGEAPSRYRQCVPCASRRGDRARDIHREKEHAVHVREILDDCEPIRHIRANRLHEHRSFGGAVTAPELLARVAIVGCEKQDAIGRCEIGRIRGERLLHNSAGVLCCYTHSVCLRERLELQHYDQRATRYPYLLPAGAERLVTTFTRQTTVAHRNARVQPEKCAARA